jgi:1,2-diacylglycerol 3-alpha-glucosyltransferase
LYLSEFACGFKVCRNAANFETTKQFSDKFLKTTQKSGRVAFPRLYLFLFIQFLAAINMRIGLLTDVYRPGFSGVANHVLLLKEAFEKLGHEVKVFAFERRPYACGDPQIIYSPGIILAANYPFGLRLSPNAAALLRTMDVVHIHQPFASGTAALSALRRCAIPLLFTSHTRYDLYTKSYLPFLPYSLTSAVIRRYMRSFGRRMTHIIAPSPSMAALLKGWGVQAPIEVIPNGIQLHHFGQIPSTAARCARHLHCPKMLFCIFLLAGLLMKKTSGSYFEAFNIYLKSSHVPAWCWSAAGQNFHRLRLTFSHPAWQAAFG